MTAVAYRWLQFEAPAAVQALLPQVVVGQQIAVVFPGKHLAVNSRRFDDELAAYAHATELRARLPNTAVPFVAIDKSGVEAVVHLDLPNDLTRAIPMVALLRQQGVSDADWFLAGSAEVSAWREVSALHQRLYDGISPDPAVSQRRPSRLVADIVTVATVFGLPLRLFNPPSAPDDPPALATLWKRTPDPEDVVLLRHARGCLTTNPTLSTWQEIRRALQHAHRLLIAQRAYVEHLPVELRPPANPDDETQPGIMFTYAAALLSDLVNKAGANRQEQLSAYLAGRDDETVRHDVGVRRAALYARRVLVHAYFMSRQKVTAEVQESGSRRR
ncbi:MAG TPA: hypothetical protein VES20_21120 [Bryobacteraceae bacterium]|nr:hypothetical protein [Bryobacteraceae bacterium]